MKEAVISISLSFSTLSLSLSLSLSLNHLPTIVLIEIHPAVRQDAYTSIPSRRTRLS
jgi:hypothetical protein